MMHLAKVWHAYARISISSPFKIYRVISFPKISLHANSQSSLVANNPRLFSSPVLPCQIQCSLPPTEPLRDGGKSKFRGTPSSIEHPVCASEPGHTLYRPEWRPILASDFNSQVETYHEPPRHPFSYNFIVLVWEVHPVRKGLRQWGVTGSSRDEDIHD